MKHYAIMALVAVVVLAIVYRVPQLKTIVTGA